MVQSNCYLKNSLLLYDRIGKLVTILYAIVGIPLMLLFLSNIGDAMANSFKFLYWKVCCILCVSPKKSRRHHRRRRMKKKQKNVEQIAMQRMPTISEHTTTSQPDSGLYPQRTVDEREMGSAPIICNMYALQANDFDDAYEPKSNAYTSLTSRPFYTLPNNYRTHDQNRLQTTQPTSNSLGFQRMSQRLDNESEDNYSSDESVESDSLIEDIPNVPITLAIALVVSYICGGGFLFHSLEGWTFLDASYFSFVTLTTIGFGDLVPGTGVFNRDNAHTIMGICAVYLLFGMALLAMSFNLVKEEFTKKIRLIGQRIGILTKDESDYESD